MKKHLGTTYLNLSGIQYSVIVIEEMGVNNRQIRSLTLLKLVTLSKHVHGCDIHRNNEKYQSIQRKRQGSDTCQEK